MNKKIFAAFSAIYMLFMAYQTHAAVGNWKTYMAYHDVQEIEQGNNNLIYILASNGLYTYNTNDESIQTYDKVNGLSDCTITHIKWNKNTRSLIIAYDNANIDIMLANGEVVNISDLYSKSMNEDKTINDIYIYGKHALMATGFGIVDVNMEDYYISNTYNIGINVNYCYIENNYVYAASKANGIYSCSRSTNMLDKNNWKYSKAWVNKTEEDKTELKDIVNKLSPGGPKYNYFGQLKYKFNKLYTCGGREGYYSEPGCVQVWDGNDWTIYQDNIQNITNISYVDIKSIAIDPKDENHVFASGRTGVYEFQNGIFQKHFSEDNAPFNISALIDKDSKHKLEYILTLGIEFDANSNLWVLNSQAERSKPCLAEYNGTEWSSWTINNLIYHDTQYNLYYSLPNMNNIFFDSRGLMWFVNNHYYNPSAYCYQPSTGGLNSYTSFTNQDGTSITMTYVRCVAEDKNGDMWIGTNQGPLILEQTKLTETNPVFTQVKVPRNDGTNYADYLLSGVDISCIAIDGGNRKWFGTYGNGVYLISDDNIQQLQHFTADNSSLLSNNVQSIAINDNTGEVFFATEKGLCSYMSDASTPSDKMEKDNVWAYPNPVKPDYTGLITITGLSNDADVKIATSNGVLVAEGRSNGGMFTWDGNDKSGKRVASGIYMVEAATEAGEKGVVCKIAIIR